MTKVALQGGAYQAHSVIASAQRCCNLVQEPVPEAQGEPMPSAAYPTPGTRLLGSIGPGPIRGIRQSTTGATYCVSGSGVYLVDTTAWTGTLLGSITAGLRTPVSMADNGLDMVIVDGTANGWKVKLVGNVFAQISNTAGTITPVADSGFVGAMAANDARYTPFDPTSDAFITSATITLGAGYTGHLKCSIFDSAANRPSGVLGSAATLTNPSTGDNRLSFPAPVAVTAGSRYWIGFDSDTNHGTWALAGAGTGEASATPYASFPAASPVVELVQAPVCSLSWETDPGSVFVGADRVDYLDTYLLFNKPGTPQFYSSDSLAVTFDPLWFANKESYSDLLQTLVVAKRNIWLMGAVSTEVWANVGKPDFPFESQGDVFIDHGVVAKYSVAEYDNGVFWLSRDRQGQGIVIMGAGYQTKRVSTYAIEAEIAGYARIDDAIGYCYQLSGHAFYVLIFPRADKTWVYDITTGLWHEWVWIDANGDEHRHRSNCYWPVSGTPVVGDWQNGNLYALDQRVYTDNGQPIKRVRSFPHILADGKRVFYRQFVADMETGTSPAFMAGTLTLLDAEFNAADGTNLSAYTSDVGGAWAAVGGASNAEISANRLVGTGGTALYQSASAPLVPDYTLRFNVVPPVDGEVEADTTLWAIGRATGADTGYRVAVSADGSQYHLSLAVLPSGTAVSVAMGTIASGTYTAWLLLRGNVITAQVQRSVDGWWLRDDATWHVDAGTTAARFTDNAYTAPGTIRIGGVWP